MDKLDQLEVWMDETPRTGAENMAVDELLLASVENTPILRFYQWSRPEVSFGYFQNILEVQNSFESVSFVRRWTGGGVVDHRNDVTYTLIIPRGHSWTELRGADSYATIHKILVASLQSCEIDAQLIAENSGNASHLCFENPVAYDVVNQSGVKLAGAGQKRTKQGLLHQGSVCGIPEILQLNWRESFCRYLSKKMIQVSADVCPEQVALLVQQKYGNTNWLNKR